MNATIRRAGRAGKSAVDRDVQPVWPIHFAERQRADAGRIACKGIGISLVNGGVRLVDRRDAKERWRNVVDRGDLRVTERGTDEAKIVEPSAKQRVGGKPTLAGPENIPA